jgi:hypothetical protein
MPVREVAAVETFTDAARGHARDLSGGLAVEEIGDRLFLVTDGDYQAMVADTGDGIVAFDARGPRSTSRRSGGSARHQSATWCTPTRIATTSAAPAISARRRWWRTRRPPRCSPGSPTAQAGPTMALDRELIADCPFLYGSVDAAIAPAPALGSPEAQEICLLRTVSPAEHHCGLRRRWDRPDQLLVAEVRTGQLAVYHRST